MDREDYVPLEKVLKWIGKLPERQKQPRPASINFISCFEALYAPETTMKEEAIHAEDSGVHSGEEQLLTAKAERIRRLRAAEAKRPKSLVFQVSLYERLKDVIYRLFPGYDFIEGLEAILLDFIEKYESSYIPASNRVIPSESLEKKPIEEIKAILPPMDNETAEYETQLSLAVEAVERNEKEGHDYYAKMFGREIHDYLTDHRYERNRRVLAVYNPGLLRKAIDLARPKISRPEAILPLV
jgi:hypothetical protein